jgi:hypothetical protein
MSAMFRYRVLIQILNSAKVLPTFKPTAILLNAAVSLPDLAGSLSKGVLRTLRHLNYVQKLI